MKFKILTLIFATVCLFTSCTDSLIPVTQKDNALAGSKVIEELSEETPASFLVNVKNLNYNDKLVADVSGTILSSDGNTILDGQFRFNSHRFDGYTNYINNQNVYCYDATNYSQITSISSEYGDNCTFKLIKNNSDVFNVTLYISNPIVLNNKSHDLTSNSTITWNPDDKNKLGVIILVDGQYFITEDDGSVSLSDITEHIAPTINYIDIAFYRGNGKVVTGTDGRRYKLTAISETHLYTQIR